MSKKKEESEPPEYIVKHQKLYKHANSLIDTATHTHTKAYNEAVEKHLFNENGEVDFEKLENSEVQDKFVKTMTDIYVSRAKQKFKVGKDLDQLEKDMLLSAYVGTTQHELSGLVQRHGKKLNHTTFLNEALRRYVPKLRENLYASAGQHIREEHIPDIIKYVGLENKVKTGQIDVMEARGLLGAHHEERAISDSALREVVPGHKIVKKKKEIKKAA